jgi:hypothetical protein
MRSASPDRAAIAPGDREEHRHLRRRLVALCRRQPPPRLLDRRLVAMQVSTSKSGRSAGSANRTPFDAMSGT